MRPSLQQRSRDNQSRLIMMYIYDDGFAKYICSLPDLLAVLRYDAYPQNITQKEKKAHLLQK